MAILRNATTLATIGCLTLLAGPSAGLPSPTAQNAALGTSATSLPNATTLPAGVAAPARLTEPTASQRRNAAIATSVANGLQAPVEPAAAQPVKPTSLSPASAKPVTLEEVPLPIRPAEHPPAISLAQAGPGFDHLDACGGGPGQVSAAGGPAFCLHGDAAPVGVDVRAPLSDEQLTAAVETRLAATALATQVATTGGVAVPAAEAGTVPCYGDGVSGYRTQALYVVEAGKPDRFTTVEPLIRSIATTMNASVLASAQKLSGATRQIRWVTTQRADGSCVPVVKKVVVPAGSQSTYGGGVNAVVNAGYNRSDRKYSMWVDANVFCGIAGMWADPRFGQNNLHNVSAGYPRSDAGCWAYAEIHELFHTLGAVQPGAPGATRGMHCYDEYDVMCYNDGSGSTMRFICPPENEILLDCRGDSYFNPSPPAGSYLTQFWNTANNQFLSTEPGEVGSALTASIPATTIRPGVASPLEVTATPSTGAQITKVAWKPIPGCSLVQPTPYSLTATVTCPATLAKAPALQVTVNDTTGRSVTATQLATLGSGGTANVAMSIQGQDPAARTWCPNRTALQVTLTAPDSGLPVAGLPITLLRDRGTGLVPLRVAAGTTNAQGVVSLAFTPTTGTYLLQAGTSTWLLGTSTLALQTQACTSSVTGSLSLSAATVGTRISASGSVTAGNGSVTTSPTGVPVALTLYRANGTLKNLGRASTRPDGTWSVTFTVTEPGTVVASTLLYQGIRPSAVPLSVLTALGR